MYTLTFFPVSSSTSLPRYSIITEPIYQSKSQKIRNGDDAASRSTNRSQQKVNFRKILSNKTRRKCLTQFYKSLFDNNDIRSQDIVLYTVPQIIVIGPYWYLELVYAQSYCLSCTHYVFSYVIEDAQVRVSELNLFNISSTQQNLHILERKDNDCTH